VYAMLTTLPIPAQILYEGEPRLWGKYGAMLLFANSGRSCDRMVLKLKTELVTNL
jgi:hypothetical protein